MFLVALVAAFQLCIQCFGEADLFSLEESCSAWSDGDAGERCSAQVSTDMLDAHGRRLMQMESFVTRLARQEVDSESKPVREAAPGSHSRSKHAAQGSSDDAGLEEGSHAKKKSHNVLSRKSPSSDSTLKERTHSGSHHSGTTAESKAEHYNLMALRHAAAPGAQSATAPALHGAQKSSPHAEKPTHHDRSSPKEQAGHHEAGDGKHDAEKNHDSSDDKKSPKAKTGRKSKASDSEEDDEEDENEDDEDEEDEDDEDSGTELNSRVQKASHSRKEKSSASLLNPAIATVMFLMSAPAGMLLVAFGSLLWAKSHGDATMGGG